MFEGKMPINWFQAILLIFLIVLLIRWLYFRFISEQQRVESEPIVSEDSASNVHREEAIPDVAEKIISKPGKENVTSQDREGMKEKLPADVQVTYSVDFDYTPQRGEAHFLQDPENGAHIWVSGGFPQNHLSYQGRIRNGLAHGYGEAIFRIGRTDHSPLRIQGQFRDGIFMGNEPFSNRIMALSPGDFLVQLPSPPGDDSEYLLHKRFLSDGLQLSLDNRGYPPDLLVVAPQGLSAIEEDKIHALMKQAYDIYCKSCQPVRDAWVHVVPKDHVYKSEDNRTMFTPEMARAQVVGGDSDDVRFFSYQNPEATAAKQRRKAEKREEAKRREEKMGPLRGRPDVRGVCLGMRIEEAREALQGEVAEWDGPRETPGEDRRYVRPLIKIRFQDGASMRLEFCSRVSDSQLFLISYEQFYRGGIPCKQVVDKLEKKYGKPDDLHKLSSGTQYATYGLVSAVTPPDTAFGPGGAFFKTGVRLFQKSEFVEKLTIVFNDATLGYHDEAAIYEDRQEAARREFEDNRSDKVIF